MILSVTPRLMVVYRLVILAACLACDVGSELELGILLSGFGR